MFDDRELLQLTGGEDSICFQEIDGELVCSTLVVNIKQPGLVLAAKKTIEDYLRRHQ